MSAVCAIASAPAQRSQGSDAVAAPADKPQGQRVGYVRDPFGMLAELATPL